MVSAEDPQMCHSVKNFDDFSLSLGQKESPAAHSYIGVLWEGSTKLKFTWSLRAVGPHWKVTVETEELALTSLLAFLQTKGK